MRYLLIVLLSIVLSAQSTHAQNRPIDKTLLASIKDNDYEKVKKLISLTANASAKDDNGATALMWAIYKADLKMVKLLIKNGADVKAKGIIYLNEDKTSYYGSPLAIAAGQGRIDILKFLVEKCGISANDKQLTKEKTEKGWGALHEACIAGDIEIINYLFEHGADKNLQSIDMFIPVGPTPLICAVRSSNIDVVKLILSKKPRIDAVDESDINALGYAILSGKIELVKLLVEAGADLTYPLFRGAGYLMFSAYSNNTKIFKYFIEKGIDPHKTNRIVMNDISIYTLIGMCAAQGNIELLQYCIDSLKLDINQKFIILDDKEIECMPALHVAIWCKQIESTKFLIDKGADVNLAENTYGISPLIYAAFKNIPELCKYLVNKGADVNFQSIDGYSALYIAVRDNYEEVYKYLLENDADPTLTDKDGYGAYFFALKNFTSYVIQFIENRIKTPEKSWKYPYTLLYQALLSDDIKEVENLLKAGYKTDIPDSWGMVALNYAITSKSLAKVDLILQYDKNINKITGKTTPLCQALKMDKLISQRLIEKGADINLKSTSGEIPIFMVIGDSSLQLLNTFLGKGCNPNILNDTNLSVLQYAIATNSLISVKALIAFGADPALKGYKNMNAIDYAKSINAEQSIIDYLTNPSPDIIELLESGLSNCISKIAEKDPSVLNNLCKNGSYLIFALILKNELNLFKSLATKFNINVQDSFGRTPLYYAVFIGNTDFAKELLKYNSDVSLKTKNGDNALELATEMGFIELANLISSKGTKIRQNVAVRPDLYVSVGHTAGIIAIDISNDGKYMLTFGMDDKVILWETETGKEIKTYDNIKHYAGDEKGSFYLNTICFSPDNNRFLVSGSSIIAEFDIKSGEIIRKFNGIGRASYSPDGKYIIAGGGTAGNSDLSFARLFDSKSGKILFESRTACDGQSAFIDDGKFFTICTDNELIIYKTDAFSVYKSFSFNNPRSFDINQNILVKTSENFVECRSIDSNNELFFIVHPGAIARLSPDGKILATGGHDQLVILWDVATGEKIRELFGHDHYISSLCFSPDGKYLYSSSRDKVVIKWEVRTGNKILIFGGHSWQTKHVSYTPDGKYLVTTGNDYSVKIWNLAKITEVKDIKGHKGSMFGFSFSPDSQSVLTYGEDRIPRLWDFSNGTKKMTFRTHKQVVLGAGFSPDGKYCFSYSNDKKVIVWEVATGKKILVLSQALQENKANTIVSNQNPSTFFCFSADSKSFFTFDTLSNTGTYIFRFNLATGSFSDKFAVTTNSIKAEEALHNQLSLTPDGKFLICGFHSKNNNSEVHLVDLATLKTWKYVSFSGFFKIAFFNADYSRMLVYNDYKDEAQYFDVTKNSLIQKFSKCTIDDQNNIFSPDSKYFILFFNNVITLFNAQNGLAVYSFEYHTANVLSACFSPDGNFLVSSSNDNTMKIYDINAKKLVLNLIQFGKNDWVVSNPDGLFDASANAMKLLYYTSGLKVIELDQMKERYYEPNLLPKVLGFNNEKVRNVESLSEVQMFPDVKVNLNNTNLVIDLKNQGGGIGKVVILVNGKEIASDARGPKPDPDAEKLKINFDLKNHPYLKAGKENIIEVKAYNEEGYLVSRGANVSYTPATTATQKPPHLYVIASGVSDYTGDQIDLKYAAKDAEDMANALKIGGRRLFGDEYTHIYLMTTSNTNSDMQPTKANILRVFNEISKIANSSDVFILYLSGHGINWGGQDGDFYYLTKDAYTANVDAYSDPKIRSSSTISSTELTDLFKKIPALKQVMMIDACASGKAVENLMAKRDISASTLRALDRMKDRVGMYIITGCTADAVSYEASKFGQGLLTYSLLEGMKGVALREEQFIDIALLMARAQDRVPELAADIGGIQKPQVFSPYGSQSFDIGELNEQDKISITLAQPKPMYLMSVFLEEESMDDVLGLEKMVDEAFRTVSSKGLQNLIFINAKEFPDAYRIRGQYSLNGDEVELKLNLFRGKEKAGSFTIKGNKNNLDALVNEIVNKSTEIGK